MSNLFRIGYEFNPQVKKYAYPDLSDRISDEYLNPRIKLLFLMVATLSRYLSGRFRSHTRISSAQEPFIRTEKSSRSTRAKCLIIALLFSSSAELYRTCVRTNLCILPIAAYSPLDSKAPEPTRVCF